MQAELKLTGSTLLLLILCLVHSVTAEDLLPPSTGADPATEPVPIPATETVPPPKSDAPTSENANAPPPADYRVMAGDLLRIRVFDHEDLSLEVRIPAGGIFEFPLIGATEHCIGKTLEQLSAELRNRLEDGYLRKAVVNILVLEFAPRIISITGAVKNPQALHINPYERLTATQAVGRAGGISDPGAGSTAIVLRASGEPGQWTPLPIPAEAFATGSGDIVLLPGDQVIVPRIDKVYVMGEVGNAGAIENPSDGSPLTLSKAIALAGGFARFAKRSAVTIYRGGKMLTTVDVMKALSSSGAEDPLLQPGDTVFVPESRL